MNLTSPKNWKTVKLGDITSKITKGTTPTTTGGGFSSEGINFIKAESITDDGRFIAEKFAKISEEVNFSIRRSILEKNDLLYSIAGVIGRTALVTDEVLPANTNQALAIIRPNIVLVDPEYLFYVLSNKTHRLFSQTLIAQSVQANINLEQVGGLEIPLPSREEQKDIAAILGSLDDKIELLRRENKTLESIAQALFREWFVEFRFPGYEGVKVVDGVPEGWKVGKLTDIAEFLNGVASQKYPAENKNESLPVIKIREMKAGITSDTDRATSNIDPKYIIESGDLLFSWSGSLDVVLWNDVDGVLNQHLFKVSSENYPKWFYYYWTLQHLPEFKSIAESKATTMGHIQRHHLDDAEILIPDEKTFRIMSDSMIPLIDKQILNNSEIKKLAQMRDSLLNEIFSN